MFKRFFTSDHSFPMKKEEEDLHCMNVCGYRQYKETDHKGEFYWTFLVVGFCGTKSGEDGFCLVLRSDGSKKKVPIDREDRILVNGQRYGRNDWIFYRSKY